jgi:hypothetical protein
MPIENFRFFAMHYLNDWCLYDNGFVTGLEPTNDTASRLEVLWDATKYYKVIRNLKKVQEETRLAGALAAIDSVATPITDNTVDAAVDKLAAALNAIYGMNVISAASKFLWLRHRWPVVIYDAQAMKCLRESGCRIGVCDYAGYRREWRKQFSKREAVIREACADLERVKEFSLADWLPEENFRELTGARWFHERVFDKFLWWNADA